jgi:hypothetical protein
VCAFYGREHGSSCEYIYGSSGVERLAERINVKVVLSTRGPREHGGSNFRHAASLSGGGARYTTRRGQDYEGSLGCSGNRTRRFLKEGGRLYHRLRRDQKPASCSSNFAAFSDVLCHRNFGKKRFQDRASHGGSLEKKSIGPNQLPAYPTPRTSKKAQAETTGVGSCNAKDFIQEFLSPLLSVAVR